MKKTIITITTIFVVGVGSGFFSGSVQADSINDLQNKQTEVKEEREKIKENLSNAEAEIADVLLDLKDLNEEIARVEDALKHNQKMLNETEEEIEELENEINLLEEEIAELERNIETRNDILKQRITSYQKSGGNIGFLDVLFGANSFSELIGRATAITKITNSDQELIKRQEEDKAQVEATQQTVEGKLSEQNDMKTELKGMEELILEQQEQNEKAKKKLEKKEKDLKKMKAELETEDGDLAALEAQIRQDIAAASTQASQTDQSRNSNLMTLGSSNPVRGSGNVNTAINAGKKYLGVPYHWGGTTPSGFDCSGFVSWAYGQAGYSLPSSTAALSNIGKSVSRNDMQPGDLVFFDYTYEGSGRNSHVGIYIGNNQFIGAQTSTGLAIASMNGYWSKHFSGHVRRIR